MTQYEIRVETPWPAERAFDYLIDLSNFDEWDPGTKSAAPWTTALHARAPGSISRSGARPFATSSRRSTGRDASWRGPRVDSSPPRTRSRSRPESEGAIVTYVADLTLNGLLRIGDPLLALLFRRMGDKAADGLAAKLDGVRVS